ncbi:hypothetical protein [Stutzerimonas chloritidismutans]|uniref:hypothetical protein n=1 Tax=Stutzerimonas chloritidismutans TaxID=203192 RepID=UPI001D18C92A|nr:hypothetical protein [Stutzerimonas chloritidismutans]UEG62395.1 hypothetical protein LLJ08_04430 [Stutzerimonas chloritidismutans]
MPHPLPQSTDASREKIATLVGKCTLNFQRYEVFLKELLPLLDQTFDASDAGAKQIAFNTTLGSLIKAFRSVALSYEGRCGAIETPNQTEARESLNIRFYQVFATEESYVAQLESLESLVRERNYLAHHFLEDFSLDSEDSCEGAELYLNSLLLRTREWLSELKMFAELMTRAREEAAKRLADPNVACRLFTLPPRNRDEWSALDEVKALRDAEKLSAPDGYTDLASATAYLQCLGVAEDAFRQIGLNSWQQLVAESGCFELIKRKDEITGKWVRWYRSKQLRAE